MKEKRADEWAQKVYEIYCAVWQTQEYVKSALFVRGVCAHIVGMLRVRGNSIASEFSRFARRPNFPGSLTIAHLRSFELRIRQLQGRWQRRLEIEAKECEHAERRATLAKRNIQGPNVATKETPMGGTAEGSRQIPAGGNHQKVHGTRGGPRTGKPGRRPRLGRPFVECVGTLWQKATSDSRSRVPRR